MATIDEIIQLRIALKDPSGIISIEKIADESLLPVTEKPQTLFYDEAKAIYWVPVRGSNPAKHEIARLTLGDVQIAQAIDDVGVKRAECRLLELMARELGAQMMVVKSQVGSDMTQVQSIDSMYKYYKAMADGCRDMADEDEEQDTSGGSGGLRRMKQPEIAGGLA